MAKLPNSPRKTAKKVAKTSNAMGKKVAKSSTSKAKKNLAPGKSPWERKAIKSGSAAMTPFQQKMHKSFVSGKMEARKMALDGNYKKFGPIVVDRVTKATTKAGGRDTQRVNEATGKRDASVIDFLRSPSGTVNKMLKGSRNTKQTRIDAAYGLGKVTQANRYYDKFSPKSASPRPSSSRAIGSVGSRVVKPVAKKTAPSSRGIRGTRSK